MNPVAPRRHPRARLAWALAPAAVALLLATPLPAAPEDDQDTAAPAAEENGQGTRTSWWRRLWPAPERGEGGTDEAAPAEDDARRAALPNGEDPHAHLIAPTRALDESQRRLRESRIGRDPVGKRYLDLIDGGHATVAQINEFAIFLAGQGMLDASEEYFRAVLRAERGNADVWNNLGMVLVRQGETSSAKAAFSRAVALSPTLALAHYNLGTVLDLEEAYDEAVTEYTQALTLDPRLGEATFNPQVVHNERMLVVKLGLFQRRAQTLGIPLSSLPGGKLPAPPRNAAPAPNGGGGNGRK